MVIPMTTLLAQQHHRHHHSMKICMILMTHMICKQRRQEHDSWQNAKSKVTLQGTNGPWQKERVFYFTSFLFCRFKQLIGKFFNDKALFVYSAAYRQSTIHLQCRYRQKQWHLLSATFGKSRFPIHKRHTAVPTAGIYFYKSNSAIMPSHLYKA